MGVRYVKYAAGHARLEKLLRSVDRSGDFCAHGRLFAPMPRLVVEDVGVVSFPIPEVQMRALIEAAERAPYGKGPETLVDASVRDCWQIDEGRVRLEGGAWPDTFARVLDAAASGLGCPSERLDAWLYKLLVYEPGGFFLPHRDTEKVDGMIATLSLTLPSAGSGGELIVRHRGREIVADMRAEEASELAFAAFYADCTHEIRPVVEGYRLSLVFNLCLRPGDRDTPHQAPDYREQTAEAAQRLAEWSRDGRATGKLVWLLDHEYSESGLSFAALKGSDAAVAQVLASAAEYAGCDLYAAIVHIEESGEATFESGYVHGGYGRRGRHGGGEGGDGDDGGQVGIGEVFYVRHWLDGWVGRDGSRLPLLAEAPLASGELLPSGALDDAKPDWQRLHETSGNEGVSLDRAYRRAALVIWPRAKTLDVVASAGADRAVAWVAEELDRNGGAADERIEGLVSRLLDRWKTHGIGSKQDARIGMLELLRRIGDEAHTGRFLREVVLASYYGRENEELAAVLTVIGPDAAGSFLSDLPDAGFARHTADMLGLLRRLDEAHGGPASPAPWHDALRKGVRAALSALPDALATRTKDRTPEPRSARGFDTSGSGWLPGEPPPIGEAAVHDLFALAWRWGSTEEVEAAAGAIVRHPRAVTPERALPAALRTLYAEAGLAAAAPFASLWRHAADFLLARSATPPEAPRDWTIPAPVGCGCDHCKALRAFCEDSVARTARFPLFLASRDHVREIIDRGRLDLTHVTERGGKPPTLVCTKTRASHERRLAEYAEDVSNMRALVESAPVGKRSMQCAAALERLHEAIAAAGRS